MPNHVLKSIFYATMFIVAVISIVVVCISPAYQNDNYKRLPNNVQINKIIKDTI